ncbi:hypothetical protein EDC96DRAFT_573874 [Choanephora cucurbitarum]|nr:hypothetical protein EDC96DRAFT_573874 [Choanephora cucurbitarum]
MDDDLLAVYKANTHPMFWEIMDFKQQQETQPNEEDSLFCRENPIKEAYLEILKDRTKLAEKDKEESLEHNLLLICDFILTNIEQWPCRQNKTEAEIAARISQMIAMLFKNTKLNIKFGKTDAKCTKPNRSSHEASCYGGSPSSYYRDNTILKKAFTWAEIGNVGKMFTLEEKNGVFVCLTNEAFVETML